MARDEHTIKRLVRELGLERWLEDIFKVAKPAIRLAADPSSNAAFPSSGTSKFGGYPDVSNNFQWTYWQGQPLDFIAQIRLEEVPAQDESHLLPKSGLLYFFFTPEIFIEAGLRKQSAPLPAYVVFSHHVTELQQAVPPENLREIYPSKAIQFNSEITIPPIDAPRLGEMNFSEDDLDSYWELVDSYEDELPSHRMFGYPKQIQGDVFGDLPSDGDSDNSSSDWILLLQVDSDRTTKMEWGDGGCVYFCIKREDLLKRDFSKTNCVMQFH